MEFEVINDKPDPHFKNGSPDPLTPESVRQTSAAVKRVGADFGISFDGDFDRCIFFDETGKLIQNEYIIGILTEVMLSKFPGGGIIQDVRSIWSVKNSASKYSGKIFLSKAGHTHMKEALRLHDAIYGGEISAHHYFRDFVRCDSGMIPWLLMIQYLSEAQIAMSEIINFRRDKNPSSGEINFVVENEFKRISYTEAIDILRNSKPNKKKKFNYPIDEWGTDLQSEHERFLVEKHFKTPVILFDYPAKIKAFYMRLNEDGKTVRAMDILFPGIGEIVGGSQREERLDVLQERIKSMAIEEEELWWYLDLRKFGTAPHSGFGLGFERLVLFATGMGNIRDVIPFPRTPQNAAF